MRPRSQSVENTGLDCATTRIEELKIGNTVLGYLAHIRRFRKPTFHRTLYRLQEIDRLLQHRHGQVIPESDDAEWIIPPIAALFRIEAIVADGIFRSEDEAFGSFEQWLQRWAPWADVNFSSDIWSKISWCERRPKADALADALGVTLAERTLLKLTQIGACDVTTEQRKAIAKERKRTNDRLAKREKRRKAGAIPRAQYEAESIERNRPWDEEEKSRATFFRDKAKQAEFEATEASETSPSRVCKSILLATDLSQFPESAAGATSNKKNSANWKGQSARGNHEHSEVGPKDERSSIFPGQEEKTNAV
ncbi:hypothetical protein [Roseibium album]|uniref:hypothetical protein n=1 Tax=Roseibium album TaxID=311410 RepID=UPI002491D812|nr:hypothetical protein [Roseibium album]